MCRLLIPAILALILTAGCGEEPAGEANPLSVVPENSMVILTLNDPSGVVRNIDGYIRDGAPILGEKMLETLVCEQLGISSLDSMPSRYGFDPSGTVVFWMENAMPNSMGMAVSAPDLPLFLSLMEEMGVEFTEGEPVDGNPVYSFDTGDGTVYISGKDGVAVMCMSSSKVETMLGGLSSQGYEVPPASLSLHLNLAMIGPMVAGQMPMARTMMMQGLAEDPDMPDFVPGFMDVYLDGIELVLTQADQMTVCIQTGPEDFVVTKDVSFVQGTEMAELLVAGSGRDMLELVPRGDLATVRFRMPSEMAYGITRAFTDVFTREVPDSDLMFWASLASNGGVALYQDQPFHMVAAYELQEDVSLEEIAGMYTDYMQLFMDAFAGVPEAGDMISITDGGIVELEGIQYYSMGMDMTVDTLTSMELDYWITVHDGAMLIEMAETPVYLSSVVNGDYIPAELVGTGDMAGEMSLAGYLGMVMSFTPEGSDLPDIGSDVVVRWDGGFDNGAIHMEMVMNGRDALATGFAFFGLLSATM